MSILMFPQPAASEPAVRIPCRESAAAPPRLGPPARADFVRRRGSLAQGRALESLGHAVEYLMDSRMFDLDQYEPKTEQEAIQILMRLSREVFAECPEVISLRRRLRRWVRERLVHTPAVGANR